MENKELLEKTLSGRSIKDIPDQELEKIGYVKLKIGDVFQLISKESLEKRRAIAMWLLKKENRDYLYSHSRENLRYFLRSEKILPYETLQITKNRIMRLKRNGIPGIFKEEFEGTCQSIVYEGYSYYKFPTVDFMVNLFNWRVRPHPFKRRKKVEPEEKERGHWSYWGVCRLEDIVNFGRYATNKSQRERILREFNHRTSHLEFDFSSLKTREYVLNRQGEILEELGKIFEKANFPPGSLQEYKKGNIWKIIEKPFWYSYYDSDSVARILQIYENVAVEEMIKHRTAGFVGALDLKYQSLSVMKAVFPEVHENIRKRVLQRIKNLVKTVPHYQEKSATEIGDELGGFPRSAIAEILEREEPDEPREEYVNRIVEELVKNKSGAFTSVMDVSRMKYLRSMEKKYPGIRQEIKETVYEYLQQLIKKLPNYDSFTPTELCQKIGWPGSRTTVLSARRRIKA